MGRRTDVYGALTDGAAEGLRVPGCILPALVVLLSAVHMFRASGTMELLTGLLPPACWKGWASRRRRRCCCWCGPSAAPGRWRWAAS
ncbi:MAG: hypothetical protein V8S77_08015 [Oscillospiraceae bacterium]